MALWFIPDILHSQSYYSLIVVCTAGLELSVLWTGIRCYRINRADIPKKIFPDVGCLAKSFDFIESN